jgi:hypothetical protein
MGFEVECDFVCELCKYKWFAKVAAGKKVVCPACEMPTGKATKPIAPVAGEPSLKCECGSTFYSIIIGGPHALANLPTLMCTGCGARWEFRFGFTRGG